MARSRSAIVTAENAALRSSDQRFWRESNKMAGTAMRTPIASPSHQMLESSKKRDQGASPRLQSDAVEVRAPTIEPATAAPSTRDRTARTLSRSPLNPPGPFVRYEPTSTSAALARPKQIAAVSGRSLTSVRAVTARATTGQKRQPNNNTAARLSPVGSQIGDALIASIRIGTPSSASAK